MLKFLKRWKWWLAVVLVLCAAGGWYWVHRRNAKASAQEKPVTATVQRRNMTLRVICNGKIMANQEVDVKCKAGGQIIKMPFDISDVVKKGDVLVELDPVDEQRKVRQAEVQRTSSRARLVIANENRALAELALATDRRRAAAALAAAESQAADAKAKAERVRELREKKLASDEEFDTVRATAAQAASALENARVKIQELVTQERALETKRQDVVLAQAALDADEIQLSMAQDRLKDITVTAPLDGVVAKREVQVGQIIASATSNVGGGTLLLTLDDLTRIFVSAAVDESDIGRIRTGQKAVITCDGFPGMLFKGEVVRVATAGTVASNVVTFETRIEVTDGQKELLKPMMSANVEIVTASKKDVLSLPSGAVARRQASYVAMQVAGTEKKEVPVTIGLNDGTNVEIVTGLKDGDTVELFKNDGGRWSGVSPQQRQAMRGMMSGGLIGGGGRR